MYIEKRFPSIFLIQPSLLKFLMASVLITSFFKSVQPPKSTPLPIHTEQQHLSENQTDRRASETDQPQKRLKKGSKRFEVIDSPITLSGGNGGLLLTGGVSGEGRDQCKVVDEHIAISLDKNCHETDLSPLKHSPAIILGESAQSTKSPRHYHSPGKRKRGVTLKRKLSFPIQSEQCLPKLVHVRQCDPCDSFWKLTSSRLPQLSTTCTQLSPPTSGYESLTVSRERSSSYVCNFLPVVNGTKRTSVLQHIQEDHPTHNIYNLYSHYSHRTHSIPTNASGLMMSIRIKKPRRNRIIVDKYAYPRIPSHIYSSTWADIYRPLSCDEVMGNSDQCASLCKWLASWKKTELKMAGIKCDSLKGYARNKVESGDQLDDNELLSLAQIRSRRHSVFQGQSKKYYSSDSEEDNDSPSAAVLLCGPSGCGKTSSVYACAHQLKIKVHEINSSCLRDRSSMLSALREATLSRQMTSEDQTNKKGLFSFFQPKSSCSKGQESPKSSVSLANFSLILLEEVDVIFPEDRGFWSIVYELLKSTKRPFILTCSDPRCELQCRYEKLIFTRPLKSELSLHLQLLALAHRINLSSEQANHISTSVDDDIRQAFHYLHMWCSWSPGNQPMLPSNHTPYPLRTQSSCLSLPWRIHFSQRSWVHSSQAQLSMDSLSALADNQSDVDILTTTWEDESHESWWNVFPKPSLLDENSIRTHCLGHNLGISIAKELKPPPYTTVPQQRREVQTILAKCSLAFSLSRSLSHVAMVTDCLPILGVICWSELQREAMKDKRRFSHYLKSSTADLSDLKQYPTLRQ